ncbi:hypothetical protein C4K37_4074 [Pseudomonas chlororaphis subsp. piscium]|nr:hypothetical protein C4K37_4074 [Pseudomonas chlororaphis subsp. piscium]AZC45007.1 hypothetical protein C4K36_4085 [Pseudomonas chlororaphis subsp. piscium]
MRASTADVCDSQVTAAKRVGEVESAHRDGAFFCDLARH